MTNAELVALLREARSHSLAGATCVCEMCDDLLSRIDAALAAHDAVPPSEERVEWRQRGRYTYVAEVGLFHLSTFFESGEAVWLAEASGTKHTLEEAQRAALSAARGMR